MTTGGGTHYWPLRSPRPRRIYAVCVTGRAPERRAGRAASPAADKTATTPVPGSTGTASRRSAAVFGRAGAVFATVGPASATAGAVFATAGTSPTFQAALGCELYRVSTRSSPYCWVRVRQTRSDDRRPGGGQRPIQPVQRSAGRHRAAPTAVRCSFIPQTSEKYARAAGSSRPMIPPTEIARPKRSRASPNKVTSSESREPRPSWAGPHVMAALQDSCGV